MILDRRFYSIQKSYSFGTSLVVQWMRIHLPIQGTQVQSLVQEDSTCHGATKAMCHNYWAHMQQLLKTIGPRASALPQEKPFRWEAHALQLESSPCSLLLEKAHTEQRRPKAHTEQRRPRGTKDKIINNHFLKCSSFFFFLAKALILSQGTQNTEADGQTIHLHLS